MATTLESIPSMAIAPENGHHERLDLKANPIVVVIPAYNEEHFIGSVVLKILKLR